MQGVISHLFRTWISINTFYVDAMFFSGNFDLFGFFPPVVPIYGLLWANFRKHLTILFSVSFVRPCQLPSLLLLFNCLWLWWGKNKENPPPPQILLPMLILEQVAGEQKLLIVLNALIVLVLSLKRWSVHFFNVHFFFVVISVAN